MKRIIFILATALLFGGCCPCRHLTSTTNSQDSARIEVRTNTIYVPDTVFIEIPAQTAERTTADSTSHLENDYATSDAKINTDGTLYHSLNTKPQTKPVPTDKKIERRDSIVYQAKYIDREVTVEVERKLSWWEKIQIYGFWTVIVIMVITYRKRILSLIKGLFN